MHRYYIIEEIKINSIAIRAHVQEHNTIKIIAKQLEGSCSDANAWQAGFFKPYYFILLFFYTHAEDRSSARLPVSCLYHQILRILGIGKRGVGLASSNVYSNYSSWDDSFRVA